MGAGRTHHGQDKYVASGHMNRSTKERLSANELRLASQHNQLVSTGQPLTLWRKHNSNTMGMKTG
jgi:hypothetical protein